MPIQDEFLFAEGAQPERDSPHALEGLFQDIAAARGGQSGGACV
jgi:hypothetical protein